MDAKNLKRKHRDLGNRIDELKTVHGDLGVYIKEEDLESSRGCAEELKVDFQSTMEEYLLPLVRKIEAEE